MFCLTVTSFPPWAPGFCYLCFSPFDVLCSLRTLCFLERGQRFPASVGNPLFFRAIAMTFKASCLSLIQISRSLGLYFFSGGGGSCRRQGKSAAPPRWGSACGCSLGPCRRGECLICKTIYSHLRICANAHHLRSCTCAYNMRM